MAGEICLARGFAFEDQSIINLGKDCAERVQKKQSAMIEKNPKIMDAIRELTEVLKI